MAVSSEPGVSHLIVQAEALATRRQEELAGVHLLAALGAAPGAVRDALENRHAGFRRVLDIWEHTAHRGQPENIALLRRRVSAAARSFNTRSPDGVHLLLALLDDVNGSARRVLEELAVDIAGLRACAMQIGQGLSTRPSRGPGRSSLPEHPSAPRGEAVPVMPDSPLVPRGPSKKRVFRPPPTESGQAVSVVPAVGPLPLPNQRVSARRASENRSDKGPATPTPDAQFLSTAPASGDRDPEEAELAARFSLPKKKFPILTQIGQNLSLAAVLGRADPVVGRDEEVEQALDVLAKRHGNNPCLVGASGVGKTSVARAVARAIAESDGDERIVIEIPISELVAGTGVRGALAGRLSALKKEVRAAGDRVILFFDELHQLFSGDLAEELATDLKLTLARGELPCIGATTTSEYRRVIESDVTLSRRFTPVEIEEPNREDAFLILESIAARLERHHGVSYDEKALASCIAWSQRFLPGRCLPDKAIAILDLCGARTRRRGELCVDAAAVAQVVAAQANMPLDRLMQTDAERMLALEQQLCERVVGHQSQVEKIARILRRNAAGIGGRRPIGTFLLLGPTGVGKTETAKAVAEVLFHQKSAMTRIDMAEMSEAHAVAKLVGAPPGYVGHDAGGQLTEAVRRQPYQVLLLDEIEKAHPDVLTAFLAVFDEGRMTDSRGRLVDFSHTVIFLTSNIGAATISAQGRKSVGFSVSEPSQRSLDETLVSAARQALPPELYNRLDEVLPFAPLTRDDVKAIGRKLCQELSDQIELSRGVVLRVEDAALERLLEIGGFDPHFGARPLRRVIAREVEAPLAEALLSGELDSGETWVVSVSEEGLDFRRLRCADAAQ